MTILIYKPSMNRVEIFVLFAAVMFFAVKKQPKSQSAQSPPDRTGRKSRKPACRWAGNAKKNTKVVAEG